MGSKSALATAEVEVKVDQSLFAKSLAKARSMFGKSMRRMAKMASGSAGAFSKLRAGVGGITRSLGGMKSMVMSLMGPWTALLPLLGVAGTMGVSVKAFMDFEGAMARVKAVSGATSAEFEALNKQARDLGRSTSFSATEAAEAMGNFSVAGFKVNETMAAMPATLNLAAAGQLDMATASDITAKVMRGMGLDAEQATHAIDVMAKAFTTSNTDLQMLGEAFKYVGPVGKAAGASLEQLTAAIQVMSDAGIQGSMAGTGLRAMLIRLQSQPREVADVLEELGVSIETAGGRMKPLSVLVDELNASMADLTSVERSQVAATLAGERSMAGFLELLGAGGDKLRAYERRLAGAGGTAERIANTQLDTLRGSFQLLWSAISDAAISLGGAMAPALRRVAAAIGEVMPTVGRIAEGFKSVADTIGEVLVSKIRALNAWLKESVGLFHQIFNVAADAISDPLGMAEVGVLKFQAAGLDWIAKMVDGLNNFIVDMRAMFSATISNWYTRLKDGITLMAGRVQVAIMQALKYIPGMGSMAMDSLVKANEMDQFEADSAARQNGSYERDLAAAQEKARSGFVSTFLGIYADTLRGMAGHKAQQADNLHSDIRKDREGKHLNAEQTAAKDLAMAAWEWGQNAVRGIQSEAVAVGQNVTAEWDMANSPDAAAGVKDKKKKDEKDAGNTTDISGFLAEMQKRALGKKDKAAEETAKATKDTAQEQPQQTSLLKDIRDSVWNGLTAGFTE